MLWLLFIVVYVAAALIAVYGVIKYTSIEAGHLRKYMLRVKTSVSRFILLTRVLKLLLVKPATVLAVASLTLIILVPATSASHVYTWVIEEVRNPVDNYAVHVEFTGMVKREAVVSVLNNYLRSSAKSYTSYLRVVLDKPLNFTIGEDLAYVVIGVDGEVLNELTGSRNISGCLLCKEGMKGEVFVVKGFKLLCVDQTVLTESSLINDEPLLPVQAYLGVKPVLPPAKNVVVLNRADALRIINASYDAVTDVVVLLYDYVPPSTLYSIIDELGASLKNLKYYLGNNTVLAYSVVPLPTGNSVITAIIASVLASVIIISIYTSLLPEIKVLYDRLAVQGSPPWNITLIIVALTTTTIFGVGVTEAALIYCTYGGVSAFTSLITLFIVWASVTAYLNKKSKPKSLLTDVYVPVTRRYELAIKDSKYNVSELASTVCELIKSNEFFITDEVSVSQRGQVTYIHARLHYTETWGSGVDLNVSISRDDEVVVSISVTPWGIEEISEAVVQNMMSLAVSRIAGGVRVWLHRE